MWGERSAFNVQFRWFKKMRGLTTVIHGAGDLVRKHAIEAGVEWMWSSIHIIVLELNV